MLEDITNLLNEIITLRKENKTIPDNFTTNLNNLILNLNNHKDKETILLKLYTKKDSENKPFFDAYYLSILKLLNLNFIEVNNLLSKIPYLPTQIYLFNTLKTEEKIEYLIKNTTLNSNLINHELKNLLNFY